MDLFRITRYYGDDEKTEKPSADHDKKLDHFLKSIKKRKRDRDATDDVDQSADPMTTTTTLDGHGDEEPEEEKRIKDVVKKKSKKRKRNKEDILPSQLPVDEPDVDDDATVENVEAAENRPSDEQTENDEDDTATTTTTHGTQNEESLDSDSNTLKVLTRPQTNTKSNDMKVTHTLPDWIKHPIRVNNASMQVNAAYELDNCNYLLETTKSNLEATGISKLFCIQEKVIPFIASQYFPNSSCPVGGLPQRDVCVSAPTGSGKTLCYAIPIVQILSMTKVTRLQCLVVLPSKDLASQIKAVFEMLVKGTRLKVGLAAGVKSVARETEQLTRQCSFGHISNVDILVATPGRLIDHIAQTPGFTLTHLQFLVIDEADRLLGQSYFGWIDEVLNAVYNPKVLPMMSSWVGKKRSMHDQLPFSMLSSAGLPLQKFLLSATLTQNPEKLASLHLYDPIFFLQTERESDSTGSARFSTPSSLTEKMIVCSPEDRPLVILHLLVHLKYKRLLCFTSSIEATHRLFLLLENFGGISVAEFSSSLNQTQRKGILRRFRAGQLDVLVCSDAMARGMDIEDVHYVVSYQPPTNIKTYIHRVGRTARAGQPGTAISILARKEVHHFKEMLSKAGNTAAKMRVKDTELEPLLKGYNASLDKLKEQVSSEKSDSVNKRWGGK